MKNIIILFVFIFLGSKSIQAQYVESGEIIFEVKTNLKKSMGNSGWAEMMKDKMPNFKTSFYKYSFSDNKSLYRFDHWENKDFSSDMMNKSDEQSLWFSDLNANKLSMIKEVFGTSFNIQDSISKIEWKLSNENRIIAGYNCRKATGKIMDSVYVFVFYTEDINISGGPCSINGLPGMILGMTIPRMYTSWIATSIGPLTNASEIKSPEPSKNIFTKKTIGATVYDKIKDWSDGDDPDSRKWLEMMIWSVML